MSHFNSIPCLLLIQLFAFAELLPAPEAPFKPPKPSNSFLRGFPIPYIFPEEAAAAAAQVWPAEGPAAGQGLGFRV